MRTIKRGKITQALRDRARAKAKELFKGEDKLKVNDTEVNRFNATLAEECFLEEYHFADDVRTIGGGDDDFTINDQPLDVKSQTCMKEIRHGYDIDVKAGRCNKNYPGHLVWVGLENWDGENFTQYAILGCVLASEFFEKATFLPDGHTKRSGYVVKGGGDWGATTDILYDLEDCSCICKHCGTEFPDLPGRTVCGGCDHMLSKDD